MSLIYMFIGSWNKIYSLLAAVCIAVYSYLINRNAKLKYENQSLNKEVEDIGDYATKIVTIQKKQAEIAASPPSSRADLYKQLRQIAARRTKIEP